MDEAWRHLGLRLAKARDRLELEAKRTFLTAGDDQPEGLDGGRVEWGMTRQRAPAKDRPEACVGLDSRPPPVAPARLVSQPKLDAAV